MNLDRREKAGLFFGGVAFLLVLALLAYIPAGPRKDYERSRREVARKRHELQLTRDARDEERIRLRSQEALKQRLQGRSPSFDLYAFLDKALAESRLKDRARIDNVTSRRRGNENQPAVKVSLEGVSLGEVVKFLHRVHDHKDLVVMREMWIRPASGEKGLLCSVTFATLKV